MADGEYYTRVQNSWHLNAPDITSMIGNAIVGHMDHPAPDAVLNIETHLFNTILSADCCNYDLDVGKQLWLNVGRWSRLIKEYLAHEYWLRFRDQCVEIISGEARLGATANMPFRDPDRYAKKHRWGGCLMGATFRGNNGKAGPGTLTFYSRTTYIGYMGVMDAAIASVMAAEITRAMAERSSEWREHVQNSHIPIAFRWYISSQQFHSFKSLPYIYSEPTLMARLEQLEYNRIPVQKKRVKSTWYHLAKWYFKVVDGWEGFHGKNGQDDAYQESQNDLAEAWLATEKYGPFKRIKRRWLEHKRILTKLPPKSLHITALDFSKAI